MPIHVVAAMSGIDRLVCARSPIVALTTDCSSPETAPGDFLGFCNEVHTVEDCMLTGEFPSDSADGALLALDGERLIDGTGADLRRLLMGNTPQRWFMPVNIPYMPVADLVAMMPRVSGRGAVTDKWTTEVRFLGTPRLSPATFAALKENPQSWARLYLLLLREAQSPGAAIEGLGELWRMEQQQPRMASLVLRNLVLAQINARDFPGAEQLLRPGQLAYPKYAELWYLDAILKLHKQTPAAAIRALEKAMQLSDKSLVGCGGENSYRASWLMGTIFQFVGEHERALRCFLPGLHHRPAFPPAVEAMIRLRLPKSRIGELHWTLCELARREPGYAADIVAFLLGHKAFSAAARIINTLPWDEGSKEILDRALRNAQAPTRRETVAGDADGVILEGPILDNSSLARINRELAHALSATRNVHSRIEPHGYAHGPKAELASAAELDRLLTAQLETEDLTIRHHWPPDFRRPDRGKLAHIFPWELGSLPCNWVRDIRENVDELWVPSYFVRDVAVRAGVPRQMIQVIPNGVDTKLLRPDGPRWRPEECREFVFLFVGGLIRRKGFDLLLQAYGDAFTADDDVTLIIKEFGSNGVYQHNSLVSQVDLFRANSTNPHVVQLNSNLDDTKMADLYRGSNVLVLPYRGEGFGMPLLEAMACGRPVITTAAGPAPEYCDRTFSWLIPAEEVACPEAPPPLGPMTETPTWYEPDLNALAIALREAARDRKQCATKGRLAVEKARAFDWQAITPKYVERAQALLASKGTSS